MESTPGSYHPQEILFSFMNNRDKESGSQRAPLVQTQMPREAIQSHLLLVLQWVSILQDTIEASLLWNHLVRSHFLLVLQWLQSTKARIEASLLWEDLVRCLLLLVL